MRWWGRALIPDTAARPLPGATESLSTPTSLVEQPAPPQTCPRHGAASDDTTRGRVGMPAPGQQDQRMAEGSGSIRRPGGAPGANIPKAYVPVTMDPRHVLGDGPSRSPMPGWALDIHEAELSFEPPPSPADVPNSGNLWVHLMP